MKYLSAILAATLIFIIGCDEHSGSRGVNLPSSPIGTVPTTSPSSSPAPTTTGPVAGPTSNPTSSAVYSGQGFSIPSCHAESAKPFYVSITRNSDSTFSAFADLNNQAFFLKDWTLTVALIKDGSVVTITEFTTGSIPSSVDYMPVHLEGNLLAKCSTDDPRLSIDYVYRANNTFIQGTIGYPDGTTETVAAMPGLCIENGYIPAWQRECTNSAKLNTVSSR